MSVIVDNAKEYIAGRKPENGAGLLAHQLLHEKPFRALVPLNTSQERSESLRQGVLTGWDDTVPALLRVFNAISNGNEECFVCAQMLIATEKDFPEGEDFEIKSRPYRFTKDGVTYVSAPLADMNSELLCGFVKYDIGFDVLLILFDRPFQLSWFDLDRHQRQASILAIAYDTYDGESFIYSVA
ncbi:hypothetical protein PUV54_14500 [Hyphococcus flavus]|uniref:Uncharacterized protein n=1 Tax=Hyphococcus flavus TaxID=1866326 RepID=A0AAE9ZEA6_9PROT|nr:hypothetical protein [Hyphococcus flavus]WDI31158.1 hypothetical protein PUV54_14500 [Hyphococcus flavus]